ncbi:MAG: hypothetical protein OXI96_08865 [Acidimicrobiaceae bacterium]|nr:hypothetical protein [Acidimicrobiaceae bacterium]
MDTTPERIAEHDELVDHVRSLAKAARRRQVGQAIAAYPGVTARQLSEAFDCSRQAARCAVNDLRVALESGGSQWRIVGGVNGYEFAKAVETQKNGGL